MGEKKIKVLSGLTLRAIVSQAQDIGVKKDDIVTIMKDDMYMMVYYG